ncbi:MAG: hypothetical protein HOO96_27115 [Polyangiaceae bacterium]|nr:hypothetical protein [Polyangiaceae bacterium]
MTEVMTNECRKVSRLLGPSLDGELDAASTIEVDEHVGSCAVCREQVELKRAMGTSVRRMVKTSASSDFRSRALAAMKSADLATVTPITAARKREPSLAWRALLPLTAAAAVAVAWNARFAPKQHDVMAEGSLSDIIAEHSRPLDPESNDPKQIRRFERYVGVPVRPPVFSQNAKLVGGRVLPVNHERAAMLQYEIERNGQQQRVSVFIYDPNKIHVEGLDPSPRAVGSSEVRVGRANGYSVAVTQREGVGYLVASDLDPDLSADLIAHAQDN